MLEISEGELRGERGKRGVDVWLCVRGHPRLLLHDKEAIGGMVNDLTKRPAGNIIIRRC